MRGDCTARQYLQFRPAASLAQSCIIQRSHDYTLACRMWASNIAIKDYAQRMDQVRVNDLARMAATLAFLAFPDLRDDVKIEEVA
jgi:hypothetical protein